MFYSFGQGQFDPEDDTIQFNGKTYRAEPETACGCGACDPTKDRNAWVHPDHIPFGDTTGLDLPRLMGEANHPGCSCGEPDLDDLEQVIWEALSQVRTLKARLG